MNWWVKDSAVIPRGIAWSRKNVNKKIGMLARKKLFATVSKTRLNHVNVIKIVI